MGFNLVRGSSFWLTIIPVGWLFSWAWSPPAAPPSLSTQRYTPTRSPLCSRTAGAPCSSATSNTLQPREEAIGSLSIKIALVNPSELKKSESDAAAAAPAADLDSIFASGSSGFTPAVVGADVVASLLYTSGTTSDPKGVMLTHANLLGEVESVFSWAHVGPEDAVLGVLPLFHVLSQMANLLLPLVKGARVVYLETLNTTELLRALNERQITIFAVVPQFFYLIHERIFKEVAKRGQVAGWALKALMSLNRGLRSIGINAGRIFFGKLHSTFGDRMRYLITGGSRFDPQIGYDFYALGIDVLQAYGLTETTGAAFAALPHHNVIGSVGPPLPGVEGKIAADPWTSTVGGSFRPLPVGSENSIETSGLACASLAFFGRPSPVVTSMHGSPCL